MRLRLPHTFLPSRVVSTGLVSAGLFAAILGATGATAQEATPEASPTATPAAAALVAEPTPAATGAPLPEASPTVAASTPEATPSATAEASPTAAAATPEATPAETATPEATPGEKAEATPTAEARKKQTKRSRKTSSRKRSRADRDKPEEAPADELAVGEVCEPQPDPELDAEAGSSAAGLPADAPAVLTDEFPTEEEKADAETSTSTSARECDEEAGDKKRKKKRKKKKADRDHNGDDGDEHAPHAPRPVPTTNTDGSPATGNPGYALAQPGPARIGVPNFFIEKFRIPPFLLPIYQAAGIQYGIRWEILAAINEIETDYGRNLNVSSAGALGWMQFMPATWKMYGTDANKDGLKDPYNPVDAIFAAARYLRAAGGDKDLRKAIFAYNHANWYVDSVLMRARLVTGLPTDFVGSLTGLTQGRFPVHARSTYAGDLGKGKRWKEVKSGNAAYIVQSQEERRGIDVFAKKNSPVVAVNDGRITKIGTSERLGRFVQLQDVYGNTYTYAQLGEVAKTYPAPKERKVSKAAVNRELDLPRDAKPTRPASRAERRAASRRTGRPGKLRLSARRGVAQPFTPAAAPAKVTKERLFANPARPNARKAGGERQLTPADYQPAADDLLRFDPKHYVAKPLREGARVIGGTMLGRIGAGDRRTASHLKFEIRPAGKGAPRVDPKPILDGWKLLESTAIYRAKGKNPFFGADADAPTIGQILLMSQEALERRVLTNPRIDVYACGRDDIRAGAIDRRVLASLEYLAASGLRPTVSSMQCGHGLMTASGNISQHSTGDAVDIAAINGVPIIGHQGKGSVTDMAIRKLLALQGTMKPDQIISLMKFEGADNTLAMGDHDDHIHVGWQPLYDRSERSARRAAAILKPKQWIKLIDRLGEIDNPEVRLKPSRYSVKVKRAR